MVRTPARSPCPARSRCPGWSHRRARDEERSRYRAPQPGAGMAVGHHDLGVHSRDPWHRRRRHRPDRDQAAFARACERRGDAYRAARVAENSPVPSLSAAATPTGAPATKPAAATARPRRRRPRARRGSPPRKPPPAVQLAVQEASAFGPDGVADGDNPQGAPHVITPGSPLPWQTDWYTTATFGMLKDGTGLLLDMGRTVTVTSVQIRLGSIGGADLQVRAGDAASLGASPVLASAQDAGRDAYVAAEGASPGPLRHHLVHRAPRAALASTRRPSTASP